jgi:hypothetical protein
MLCVSRLAASACAAFLFGAAPAAAATYSIHSFARTEVDGARAAYDAVLDGFSLLALETFEGLTNADIGDTAVGGFSSTGPNGSGASATGGGKTLDIRSGASSGRQNLTALSGASQWLDSNDRSQVTMTLGGVGAFDRAAFFLTDVADVSGKFTMTIPGAGKPVDLGALNTAFATMNGVGRNGVINVVSILFDAPVSAATIRFDTNRNDGFGIDDVALGRAPAAIPAPAALPMLVLGLLSLALVRRMRAR